MKTDAAFQIMVRERRKGKIHVQVAARATMHVNTARTYERAGTLPSQHAHRAPVVCVSTPLPQIGRGYKRTWNVTTRSKHTRSSPCSARTNPTAVRRDMSARFSGAWHVGAPNLGGDREVIFAHVHQPVQIAQSDVPHMTDLQITLAGQPFPHLLYHLVLTYSNREALHLCASESLEALVEGFETCLWELGGVPQQHRTDHLSAAVHVLDATGRKEWTDRYAALMAHDGMQPTTNTPGTPNQNGDVEHAHYRLKQAIDQALRVRGTRDVADRAAYVRWLHELVRQRNQTRQQRRADAYVALRPLPRSPLAPCRELRLTVRTFRTMTVIRTTYSVPSRLIGMQVTVRVRADTVELYVGTPRLLDLPRVRGQPHHRIDYRHIIWSLVRKPGAFANDRYRDALFPALIFRRAYDMLVQQQPTRADKAYMRILYLAASTSEMDVEAAVTLLVAQGRTPTFEATRALVRAPVPPTLPQVTCPQLDLHIYDTLLATRGTHA